MIEVIMYIEYKLPQCVFGFIYEVLLLKYEAIIPVSSDQLVLNIYFLPINIFDDIPTSLPAVSVSYC